MATIKDVARLAGVGLGTASRVVSGRGAVSAATRARVEQAIAALDFRPSQAARALLSGCAGMVGVYLPASLPAPQTTALLRALEARLRAAQLHLVVAFGAAGACPTHEARTGVEFLLGRGCDGVLVADAGFDAAELEAFGARRARVLLLDGAALPWTAAALDALALVLERCYGRRPLSPCPPTGARDTGAAPAPRRAA